MPGRAQCRVCPWRVQLYGRALCRVCAWRVPCTAGCGAGLSAAAVHGVCSCTAGLSAASVHGVYSCTTGVGQWRWLRRRGGGGMARPALCRRAVRPPGRRRGEGGRGRRQNPSRLTAPCSGQPVQPSRLSGAGARPHRGRMTETAVGPADRNGGARHLSASTACALPPPPPRCQSHRLCPHP